VPHIWRRLVVFSLLAAALWPAAAHAGLYMEHEAILPNPADMTRSLKQTLHSWHEGKRFKRESPLRGETVIIDLEKREVYGVNEQKKTYWKMPAERYQQLAMMSLIVMGVKVGADGQLVVPDPLFAQTSQTSTIEGRKAVEVKIAGELPPGVQTSIWVSKDVPIDVKSLVEQMRISLGDPRGAGYEALFRQWGSLGGYPIQNVTTIRTPNGVITTSETLLTFREMKIPDSEFQVPKGFALVTDPVTELERAAAGASGPVGIGAPLSQKPARPVGAPAPAATPAATPAAPSPGAPAGPR
jgi:hypothetical protein